MFSAKGIITLLAYLGGFYGGLWVLNWVLYRFELDPLSFWIGFGIPCFIGLTGGIYVVGDQMGFFDTWTKSLKSKFKRK